MTSHTGRLAWKSTYDPQQPTVFGSGYADIAPSTGNLSGGTMSSMMQTSSLYSPLQDGNDMAVSYGFYDAGSGKDDELTNRDQCYVYVTEDYSDWMGGLYNEAANKVFASFALPGAHDAGMYDTSELQTIAAVTGFLGLLGGVVGYAVVASQSQRIAINLAMTQKDVVKTMLNLGIRYFDFRPGYLATAGPAPGALLYHQHLVVPGVSYATFLSDVLSWLTQHEKEIVVVSNNFQGFKLDSMKPTAAILQQYLDNALNQANTSPSISPGLGPSYLKQSYSQLLENNNRLLFLSQIPGGEDAATKYDSYSDLYNTTCPANIIDALQTMSAKKQFGADYTVLQLQGTATGSHNALAAGSLTLSDASSPLMSTKAAFDAVTYPWVEANVPKNLSSNGLVVLLNDFSDNALANCAISLTRQRMGLSS